MVQERDVIVTSGGGNGGLGPGLILGIVITLLVVVVLIWGFGFNGFSGNRGGNNVPVSTQSAPKST